jgi:hypothetical protein
MMSSLSLFKTWMRLTDYTEGTPSIIRFQRSRAPQREDHTNAERARGSLMGEITTALVVMGVITFLLLV